MQAKRRDEREREKNTEANRAPQRSRSDRSRRPQGSGSNRYAKAESAAQTNDAEDDFYDRYSSDMDKDLDERVSRLLDED